MVDISYNFFVLLTHISESCRARCLNDLWFDLHIRAAPTVQFDACISGVDSVRRRTWGNFLNEHKIVYASLKCYSKPDSSSKTFKVSLPPHQYRELFNPSLWDSGICVKRFFNPRDK